jgi:prophage regulatory protein
MQPSEFKLLNFAELKAIVGLSRVTVWRLVRAGKFPAPIEISPGRRAWDISDVRSWLAARKPAADKAA